MKTPRTILSLLAFALFLSCQCLAQKTSTRLDMFGEVIEMPVLPQPQTFTGVLSDASIRSFVAGMDTVALTPFLNILLRYKEKHGPDDWLYYQSVRKVAQQLSPKAENYYRYTFYKWWILTQSGYDAILSYAGDYLLFYVQSDEAVYNIPYRVKNGKQYICLNYHDYGNIDFAKYRFTEAALDVTGLLSPFSYKVTRLPEFTQSDYTEKEVRFADGLNQYSFQIKVNPQVKAIFTNYPVVDYSLQFNMPVSRPTYESLISPLKKQVNGFTKKDGVEFLMRFTRYAFLFKPDAEVFGSEKRMSPEQTLLYEYSDCEDRAALFFYLVKEIYNLPMLVLTYPQHVTVAVQFDKGYGKTIEHNGMKYSICEPSPQRKDLKIGQFLPELSNNAYQIAYVYQPVK